MAAENIAHRLIRELETQVQPMRLVDHLYFVAEHDDHHLAKIWELIDTHFPKG